MKCGNAIISTKNRAKESDVVRFWRKVDRSGGCWVFTGAKFRSGGYGAFRRCDRDSRGLIRAHRFSWMIAFGSIPSGLHVLHRCDNPPCVRPQHLFLGTDQDNISDMMEKKRRVWRGMKGQDHPGAIATDNTVRAIRSEYAAGGMTIVEIGKRFGLSAPATGAIIHRRHWAHVE